jgi:predicted MFS family arabinose efflux permease
MRMTHFASALASNLTSESSTDSYRYEGGDSNSINGPNEKVNLSARGGLGIIEEPSVSEIESVDIEDLGFSASKMTVMCISLFLCDILVNVDHGAIPAGIKEMQDDFELETIHMGNFGSLCFFGLAVGSVFSAFVVGKISWKVILQLSFIGNGFGLFLYAISSDFYYLAFARFLSGFNQVFLVIYMPLYVDAFSKKELKTTFMSSILLAPPIGVLIGYGLTATTIGLYENWRISFLI